MKKSDLFPALPDIFFTSTDTEEVSRLVISAYEKAASRTLSQADPVRLFLLAVSSIIVQQRALIDISAKNNLLTYAQGEALDHIAAFFGVTRLDGEDDENLRARIACAPDSFSTAGPEKAYEYYASTASPDIIDVKVLTPPDTEPGHVHIYPLMKGGTLPDAETLDAVLKACSDDNVRPDTDYVEVLTPSAKNFTLSAKYWIRKEQQALTASITKAAEASAQSWIEWQKSALGRDINPSELTSRLVVAGVKRVEITSPVFTDTAKNEVAICTASSLVFAGLEDD